MTNPVIYPGYQTAPQGGPTPASLTMAASALWVRRIVDKVNDILSGKINVVLQVTLRASQTTTTITDSRIGPFSALLFTPLSANAAAAASSIYVLPADQMTGSAVIHHASSANADQTFNLAIIG